MRRGFRQRDDRAEETQPAECGVRLLHPVAEFVGRRRAVGNHGECAQRIGHFEYPFGDSRQRQRHVPASALGRPAAQRDHGAESRQIAGQIIERLTRQACGFCLAILERQPVGRLDQAVIAPAL